MSTMADNVRYIRELRNQYNGRTAIILAKGPSLDVWYDRGEHIARPADSLVLAVNESAILPDLNPDFWFWLNADHYHWERMVEDFSPDIPQVVAEPTCRRLMLGQSRRPTWTFMRGVDAPDDPYAVPGVGTPAAAALFCTKLWGCLNVLAVGFDAADDPDTRTYAACLTPWLIKLENKGRNYRFNNNSQQQIIDQLQLEVAYYHRSIPPDEIQATHQKYKDHYGPVIPLSERE